jgi:hypothetical protein
MSISFKRLFRYKRTIVNPLVQRSFNSKFPKATHVLWQQVDAFRWHVNFIWEKKKSTALFNSEGKWLETVTLMPFDKIPEQLQLTLDEKNNRDGLQRIYHVQTPDRSLFELNLNNGIYTLRLLYDLSGKIIDRLII